VLVTEEATFRVAPAASGVLVEARSSVGPITFGTMAAEGQVETAFLNGAIDMRYPTVARLVLPVTSLTSGNRLYDAELHSRLDARRFPEITAELRSITPLSPTRYAILGALTIHGTTRELSGALELSLSEDGTVVVTGHEVIDIRDFSISLPTVLMLKIFPDVTVQFRIQAIRETQDQESRGSACRH
jgi:hypothetical protein